MAFERKNKVTNPNRSKMSVADISHPIVEENKRALRLLSKKYA